MKAEKPEELKKMKMERFLKKMTLDRLSFITEIDQAKLSRIERGYTIAKEQEKMDIAKALECSVLKIFPKPKKGEKNERSEHKGE